jgi:hypothetical protein
MGHRCVASWRQGMGFAGQDGEGGCHLGQSGADVGAGRGHGAGASAGVVMACVRLRDGEAEAALDPRQDRVPYPVHGDLLGFHPRKVLTETVPEVVVPAVGDRLAVRVPEETLSGVQAASGRRVWSRWVISVGEAGCQRSVPPFRVAG